MPIGEIAAPIALAVLKVAVIALIGYALARCGILHSSALADISGLVIKVTVPCLIFANAASGRTGLTPASSLAAMAAAPVLLGLGYVSGLALSKLTRVQPGHLRAVLGASTFQNASYLPITVATSVLPPLAAAFPLGRATAPGAIEANGLVAISLFIVLYSPIFWGIGLWWIMGSQAGSQQGPRAWLPRLFPPPVWGVLSGYLVGLTPLHQGLTPPQAPLHFLFQAISDIGSLTIPLANLILGGMLAEALAVRVAQARDALCMITAKLFLTPGLTLILLWLCRAWWSKNPALALAAFIILLEAASPPATNLAVMSKRNLGEPESRTPLVIPGLLLVAYPLAILTMPLWLLAFFRLLSQ